MVEFMTTSGVSLLKPDASGNPTIYNSSGTALSYIDTTSGGLIFLASGTVLSTGYEIVSNGAVLQLNVPSAKGFQFLVNGSQVWILDSTGRFTKFANVTTVGTGVPAIVASSVQNPSNAAPTTLSLTPPATAGYYRVSYYLDITTATTVTFIAKLTYTDPAGTARSANLSFINEGGTAVLAGGPAANTAGQWYGSQTFAINNAAAAITVADNAGTYTTTNYRWQVTIEQLI